MGDDDLDLCRPLEVNSRGAMMTPKGNPAACHQHPGQASAGKSIGVEETIVARYSDHIALPILLKKPGAKEEKLNEAAALWMRPKSEITSQQYAEFYRFVSHAFDSPRLTIHWRAEGKIDYTALLFVPGARPLDLFHLDAR